jgi:ribosomal protein L28
MHGAGLDASRKRERARAGHAAVRCSSPRGTHTPPAACDPRRSRRIWKPNVQTLRLYSDALGKEVQLKVTMHALR